MPRFRHADLDLHYEQWGARADPPLLLLHGLSCQIIHWPPGLIDRLTEAGYRVIAMDNRDMGLSSRVAAPAPQVADIVAAMDDLSRYPPPYTLSDMAADAVALLNHLGQAGAHIIGLSMGGMIAQTLAIEHPERAFSLISIMSNTGNPELPPGEPEAVAAFIADRPEDRDAAIAQYQRGWDIVAGPHYDSLTEGLARFPPRPWTGASQRKASPGSCWPSCISPTGARPWPRWKRPAWSSTAAPTRWCRWPPAKTRPKRCPTASSRCSTKWATTCRSPCWQTSPPPSSITSMRHQAFDNP